MKDVVIVGALRTPIGCFRGALAGHSAVELGSLVVKALIERTGVPAYAVDEVILGQVLTAGPCVPMSRAAMLPSSPKTLTKWAKSCCCWAPAVPLAPSSRQAVSAIIL